MVQAATAEFFRHVGSVETGFDRGGVNLLDQLRPHLVGALDLFLVRLQLLFDEGTDAVDQHLLFRSQPEIHGSLSISSAAGRSCAPRTWARAGRGGCP